MKNQILNIITENLAIEEKVSINSKLSKISVDSFSFIKILVALEKKFNIVFADNELNIKKYKTINDLIMKVQVKIDEKDSM